MVLMAQVCDQGLYTTTLWSSCKEVMLMLGSMLGFLVFVIKQIIGCILSRSPFLELNGIFSNSILIHFNSSLRVFYK